MSQKIAEAYVEISARMDRMEADLKAAQTKFTAATEKMQKNAGGLAASMDKVKLAYAAASAFIGGAFVSAVASAITSTAEHLDQLDEMSAKTGVSVEMLTSLELAAKQNSVSMEQLAVSIRMMYRSMNEAAGGNKEAVESYKRLGVEVKDAGGNLKSGNEAFLEVADAISKIQNPAERSAMAMKVFGRAGAEMIPMLQGGRKALEEYIAMAKEMGLVFTAEDAKRAAAFADQLDQLGARMRAFKEKTLLPVLEGLTEFMRMLNGEKSGDASRAETSFSDWAKYAGNLVKNLASGQSYIEASSRAAADMRLNIEAAAVAAGKYNDLIYGKYTQRPTYSVDVTANRPGSGPARPSAKGFMPMGPAELSGGARTEEFTIPDYIKQFEELQATVIDTHTVISEMMQDLQGQWGNTIAEFIQGGQSFSEFMSSMFDDVLKSFSRMLGDMAAQWMVSSLMGTLFGAKIPVMTGEVPSTGLARMGGGTSIVINAVDTQSFDDALRRNAASVTNIVYESSRYGRAN